MTTSFTPASILGPSGRISQRLKAYEPRAEQLEMADAVADAIATKQHLVVEAGTGVGKSFAYLVPAILAATTKQNDQRAQAGEDVDKKRTRVVISTHTIALQEQLTTRDIPFLNSVLPLEFSAVLVKGRGNYISLRRLGGALERASSTFTTAEQIDQLKSITRWAKQTTDGSRAALDFRPLPEVWDEVQSDHGNCLGRKCPTHPDCFYFQARRRATNADLLIVNHALFFSDLALRREGASILPDYDIVIFDEAHTIEQVAADHLGLKITSGQIDYLFGKLYNDRQNKGLLVHHRFEEGQKLVSELRFAAQDLFDEVRRWRETRCPSNGRLKSPPEIQTEFPQGLLALAHAISVFAKGIEKDEDKIELTSAAERCTGLASSLQSWLGQSVSDSVYWVDIAGRKRERVELVSAPIEVGPVLRERLFNEISTVVLTSATLAVGGQSFDFVRQRLGLDQSLEKKLGSPFNYSQNARLILPDRMPDPTAAPADFEAAVCERIRKHVAQTQGRAFVLFTSYKMLDSCARRLSSWFTQNRYSLYSQTDGMPRTMMLEKFRNDPRGVLFGADSFWQGVDVPGDALQNVIIAKLPFSVPDHPLLEARLETIAARGGVPFMEYQVPEAIIRLKQGFGRLIRTRTDTGQVVILDPRVKTKRYGSMFLDSLPKCPVIVE